MHEVKLIQPAIGQKIIGKLIIQTKVRTLTNLLIASGNDERFDFEVVRDSEGKPFIPGSSFAGMLKSFFDKKIDSKKEEMAALYDYFWGSQDTGQEETTQSHLIINDLFLPKYQKCYPTSRDAVSINHKTGVADNKYDYEFISPGAVFNCTMELTLREGIDASLMKQFISFIIKAGEAEQYFQGAFTSQYFGQIKWEETNAYFFDFTNPSVPYADAWFSYLESIRSKNGETSKFDFCRINFHDLKEDLPKNKAERTVEFRAVFKIISPLIIGTALYPDAGKGTKPVQKAHLRNEKNIPVISAKSVRGAMRHRAAKILNTLEIKDKKLLNTLFGSVDKALEGEINGIKGKLVTRESEIINGKRHLQTRIKICRLTSVTIPGALLTDETICDGEFEMVFQVHGFSFQEVKLMLHVLRDMFHGDLPLGGSKTIGRGLLSGKSLIVNEDLEERVNWKPGQPVNILNDEWRTHLLSELTAN